jgi:hypothetical protein
MQITAASILVEVQDGSLRIESSMFGYIAVRDIPELNARMRKLKQHGAVLPSLLTICLVLASSFPPVPGAETPPLPLFDPGAVASAHASASCAQVSLAASPDRAVPGLDVSIAPGPNGYPGVDLLPAQGDWDLSHHGHVEAFLCNTGEHALTIALRVDNAGDWHGNPWNCESCTLSPGQSGRLAVLFGYSYGQKRGFALNPAAVVGVHLFITRTQSASSFRLLALTAAGPTGERPALDPATVRIRPVHGILLGAGATCEVLVDDERTARPWGALYPGMPAPDGSLRIAAGSDAPATLVGQGVRITFPAQAGLTPQLAVLTPGLGRWDLRLATQLRVHLRNDGGTVLTPRIRLLSDGGATAQVSSALPARGELDLIIPFRASLPAHAIAGSRPGSYGCEAGTGTSFASDCVSAIEISALHDAPGVLRMLTIVAESPPELMPPWLGTRPPVDGAWVKTFDEEFDGTTISLTRWNITGPNYWDRLTHWTRHDLLLGDGVVRMHFEKQTGFQNDEPLQKPQNLTGSASSPYACGYLDTFGKWVQRYGYFEARLKLPQAPGLWPTFWMMPDRGVASGEPWRRQDTGHGAMEMDIMEHLTRWGPHRYNIANHWDGYGSSHVSCGSAYNYVGADQDGFITCGLLWTPGSLCYYGNGRELLRLDSPRVSSIASYLIFEITTGGWDNDRLDDARLPVDYVIDYVRCWQRRDLASGVDGFQASATAPPTP